VDAEWSAALNRRLLFLVTEDWYFLSHRRELTRHLQAAGWEIEVACSVGAGPSARAFLDHGFSLHAVPFHRESLSPAKVIGTAAQLRRLIRERNPGAVLPVALRPVILAPWVCRKGSPIVNFLAGMGSLATGAVRGLSGSLASRVVRLGLARALRRKGSQTLVQNGEDLETYRSIAGSPAGIHVVRGTGLDPDSWRPRPEPPSPPFRIIYAGRLLVDKGVRELVQAHGQLHREDPTWELEIFGERDPANPASLPAEEIEEFSRKPGVRLHGKIPNVLEPISAAHLLVLASYREGLPRVLLEAGLCARPVITSDVIGCREIVRHGETGLLVPPKNAGAIASAARRLREQPALRRRLGDALRSEVERKYAIRVVGPQIEEILREAGGARAA